MNYENFSFRTHYKQLNRNLYIIYRNENITIRTFSHFFCSFLFMIEGTLFPIRPSCFFNVNSISDFHYTINFLGLCQIKIFFYKLKLIFAYKPGQVNRSPKMVVNHKFCQYNSQRIVFRITFAIELVVHRKYSTCATFAVMQQIIVRSN